MMQKYAHSCTNTQGSNDIDESNEGLKRVVRTSFMTRELHTKASMKRNKIVSVVLCAFAALCGCWPQENPNKIYTIVLDNGKIQRTLKIPGGYLEEKNEKLRAKNGVRVGFLFPELTPFVNEIPNQESVSIYIRLISDPSRLSMSESFLNTLKDRLKIPSNENPARFLGRSGGDDVYEETDLQTHSITTIYFTQDKFGRLLKFEKIPGLRSTAWRRYADVFEISYVFSSSLLPKKLEVDNSVTQLIDNWLQQ